MGVGFVPISLGWTDVLEMVMTMGETRQVWNPQCPALGTLDYGVFSHNL